jgi:hypothetical protein
MKALAILATLALISCTRQPDSLTAERRYEIENELKQITQSIYDKASKKDLSYNDPISDSVTGIFSGTVMESWQKHKQEMAAFFNSQEKIEGAIDIIEVNVLSNTSAIVVGKYQIKATDKAGRIISSAPACITYVYQLRGDKWKVVHFHDSEQRQP